MNGLNIIMYLLNGGDITNFIMMLLVNSLNIYIFKKLNSSKNKLKRKVKKIFVKVLYVAVPLGLLYIYLNLNMLGIF